MGAIGTYRLGNRVALSLNILIIVVCNMLQKYFFGTKAENFCFQSQDTHNMMCIGEAKMPFQYKNVKSTNYKSTRYIVTYQSLVKLFRNKGRKLWKSQDTTSSMIATEIL